VYEHPREIVVFQAEDRPKKRVNLKVSVEEQRTDYYSSATRHCKIRYNMIWIGVCREISFAELRDFQLLCEEKGESSIAIPADGCFSQRVEVNLDTGCLLSWFYLGRISDLGLGGFDKLCRRARIPICSHMSIAVLAGRVLRQRPRGIRLGCANSCKYCQTRYSVADGFIELHVSRYIGILTASKAPSSWKRMTYWGPANPVITHRYQAFANWLDRMYNPETGVVFNGGEFKMFRNPKFRRN
jgi:hypothetical protein